MEIKVILIVGVVKPWVKKRIKKEMRLKYMRFDDFEKCISRQLKGIQSPELAVVQKLVDDLQNRLILAMPTIEEIHEKRESRIFRVLLI